MRAEKIINVTEKIDVQLEGITLLSAEEYKQMRCHIPKTDCRWWWLRSPGNYSNLAAYVDLDGDVRIHGNSVIYSNVAVRPALKISNLTSANLIPGDKIIVAGQNWTVISDTYAIADDAIGTHCFREDWRAKDANMYEKSDVKKYIEDWAIKEGIC